MEDWTLLYSYLNLESTKTASDVLIARTELYSYLNLESTKTYPSGSKTELNVVQLLKSWEYKNELLYSH